MRSHQDEIDALIEQTAAEKGQAAFFSVVETASELTAAGLPEGKTVAEALERAIIRRKQLWSKPMKEEDRIDLLVMFCTRLYGGNETAGQLLASAALYE